MDLSTVNIEREERHGVHPLMAFEAIPEIATGEYPYQHIQQNNLVKSSVAKALGKFKSKSPWSVKYTNTKFKDLQDEIVAILESLKKVDINKVYIRVRKTTDSITGEKQGEITLKWLNPEDLEGDTTGDKILREYPIGISEQLAEKLLLKDFISKNRFHIGSPEGQKRELDIFLGKDFLLCLHDFLYLPFMSLEIEKSEASEIILPPYAVIRIDGSQFPFGTASLQKHPISELLFDTRKEYERALNLAYMNHIHTKDI